MLSSVGLVDIAMALHPQQPPATHNQGCTPIDGIFIPVTLTEYCQVGYLAFGDAILSNHHAVWLDILAQLVCPHVVEPIEWPLAHRLQCKDPKVVTKYNQILYGNQSTGTLQGGQNLTYPNAAKWVWNHQQSSNRISKTCRKINARAIQWCPQVSQAINQILYWKGLRSQIQGCTVGSSVIKQQAKKVGIQHGPANFQLEHQEFKSTLDRHINTSINSKWIQIDVIPGFWV